MTQSYTATNLLAVQTTSRCTTTRHPGTYVACRRTYTHLVLMGIYIGESTAVFRVQTECKEYSHESETANKFKVNQSIHKNYFQKKERKKKKKFGFRAFSNSAPKHWNALPPTIR